MPLPKEEFKVFISHAATEDGKLVNWMADALDRLHIRAFVYERYPRGGQNRFDVIKRMITWCPYFLVVLTRDGIASQWVNQEIGYAVGAGKEIIPILEVDSETGRHIESKGFVELHDPIPYDRNKDVELIAQVLHTFYILLTEKQEWRDIIFLSCKCDYEFDAKLDFDKNWERFVRKRQAHKFRWSCPACQQEISISFPDCHLLPQKGT